MPRAQAPINGFTPKQASDIVGLSVHMLNYLARHEYLQPSYASGGRGRVRYYSYRDLVTARIVKRLLDAGLEIKRLKQGIRNLSSNSDLLGNSSAEKLRLLATDGKTLFFCEDGQITDLLSGNQLTFAFILDVTEIKAQVKDKLTSPQLQHFSLQNRRLRFAQAGYQSDDDAPHLSKKSKI